MFVKLFCVTLVGLRCYTYAEVPVCFLRPGETLDDHGQKTVPHSIPCTAFPHRKWAHYFISKECEEFAQTHNPNSLLVLQ